MNTRLFSLLSCAVTFILGAGIFLFVDHPFVRGTLGDVLVVAFLYSLLSGFTNLRPATRVMAVFLFALVIEFGQLFHVQTGISIIDKLVFGSTFDVIDIGAYVLGLLLIVGIEKIANTKHISPLSW